MAYQVRLSARAERDADQAIGFLQQRSRAAAERWHAALTRAIASLRAQPERCGLAPEADDLGIPLRQLLFGRRLGKYRILFIVGTTTVEVLHIRHAARQPLRPGDL